MISIKPWFQSSQILAIVFLAVAFSPDLQAVDPVDLAIGQISDGKYVLLGEHPNSFDCSGLTKWSFSQFGVHLPKWSGHQCNVNELGELIPDIANLRRGDLVFFDFNKDDRLPVSHVAIYVGDIGGGQIVHAQDEKHNLNLVSFDDFPTYEKHFAWGRRLIPFTYDGPDANAQFGYSVSPAGDIDSDGSDDFIIGSPGFSGSTGAVFVYSGRTRQILLGPVTGQNSGRWFGISVAGGVDYNSDNTNDILVGEYPNTEASGWSGRVHILSGIDASLIHTFVGFENKSFFGTSVACLRDFNGDGIPDVAVGSHRSAPSDVGKVFVYSGSDFSLLLTIDGEGTWSIDNFGVEIASLGDVNNDGLSDLGVLGHRVSNDRGRAYVFLGQILSQPLQLSASMADFSVTGNQEWLIRGISWAGDVNNDNYDDVIVSAPHVSNSAMSQVRVYSGRDHSVLHAFVGADKGHGAGDVNGDGFGDVIAALPSNNAGGAGAGRAYVYSGMNGGNLQMMFQEQPITGESPGDNLGFPISVAGDVNADGLSDIIVSALGSDYAHASAGRVFIYLGQTDSPKSQEITTIGVDMTQRDLADLIQNYFQFPSGLTANRINRLGSANTITLREIVELGNKLNNPQ